jgi:transcriptional regulator with XRE-family HTH domain/tetratricopeptide (TPR) repeat protein
MHPGMDRRLGELLASLRNLAGMTQEELADASGLSVRSISDLERDRVSRPRRRSLELLATALDLDRIQAKALIAIARGMPVRWPDGLAEGPSGVSEPVPQRLKVTPRQLPGLMGGFVGRSAELRTLSGWLDDAVHPDRPAAILTIAGAAGVGKTTLAIRWGHQIAERFPDGQLWLNLRGCEPAATPLSAAEAIRTLLDALNVPPGQIPSTPEAQAGLYRSLLAGRRILIVLDDARDTSQVRPLLPGSSGCLVVTSCTKLFGLAATEGARLLNLDVLTAGEARQLLACRLGHARLAAEPEATEELIRLCAGLPLALGIAAAHADVSSNPRLADLAVQLCDAQTRLDILDGDDPASSLRAVFCRSYQQLPPDAAHMFRLLGLHSGPDISSCAASSLGASPLPQVQEMLGRLIGAYLLTQQPHGRYAMHDLLRVYAREQAEDEETQASRHAALNRVLDHYLHTAYAAARLVSGIPHPPAMAPPGPGVSLEAVTSVEQALAWFEENKQVLIAVVMQADDPVFHGYAVRIAAALATFFDWRGHSQESIDLLPAVLFAAKDSGDHIGLAHIHLWLGRAYLRLHSFADADVHLREALDQFTALDDIAGQSISHQYLSLAFDQQGDYQQAFRHSRAALTCAGLVRRQALSLPGCSRSAGNPG